MSCKVKSSAGPSLVLISIVLGFFVAAAAAAEGTAAFPLTNEKKLTASDAAVGDSVGTSVAVSGDTAVVGAPFDDDAGRSSGSAYVFVRRSGAWSQQQKLTALDAGAGDLFGAAVAIDGDTAVVGAPLSHERGPSLRLGLSLREEHWRLESAAEADGERAHGT